MCWFFCILSVKHVKRQGQAIKSLFQMILSRTDLTQTTYLHMTERERERERER